MGGERNPFSTNTNAFRPREYGNECFSNTKLRTRMLFEHESTETNAFPS